MLVSESQALSGSASAYAEMVGQLEKKKKIEHGTPRVEKVREITERLIAQAVRFRPETAKWNWDVQVINEPKTVNAFCMAGGKMAIYTGMWEQLKATDAEVAQVMGHEISHALANHTQESMSVAMATAVATQVAAIAISSQTNSPAAGARHQRRRARRRAGDPAAEQPRKRSGSRPDRHRARRARGLRPGGRGDAVGKDGQARRRQGAARVHFHPPRRRRTAPRG